MVGALRAEKLTQNANAHHAFWILQEVTQSKNLIMDLSSSGDKMM